jgi:amidophosphoribosyltransferase
MGEIMKKKRIVYSLLKKKWQGSLLQKEKALFSNTFYYEFIIMSGFFGVISKTDCVSSVFYGTDYHSHLGTKRAGMVFYKRQDGFQRAIHSLEDGYFRTKFENDLINFSGNAGIGIISDTEAQPVVANSHLGKFAISTVSKIVNAEELEGVFLMSHRTFSETSQGSVNPTELVAMLIADGDDFVSGILNVFEKIKGSCSLLILTDNMILAARDKLGRTPVVIGKNKNGFAVASETCSFSNLDYETEKFLGPGEIVRITAEGHETIHQPFMELQICAFLWVYYGYPPSYYEGINVDEVRYRCGAALARKDNVEADFVAGIPDSGLGHAIGYSNERKIPYMRPYAKYTPTWPRSFMPQNQVTRELVAKMKLIPNPAIIRGKRGIFLDDSIVRGTQLKDNTRDLHNEGIKEVHMRIACPPLTYPCEFLNFSRSRKALELATRKAISQLEGKEEVDMKKYSDPETDEYRMMVERIRKNLGLTTLQYQTLPDLIEAIGLPRKKVCTHCWDGSSYF